MVRFLFLALLLAPACAGGTVGLKNDGSDDDTGDDGTAETGDSDVPVSEHAVTVAFTTEFHGDGQVFVAPGQSNVTFGTFVFTSVDSVGLTLRSFVPTVYVADDADASSGWHASHQGNVWARDHLASCVLRGYPNADVTLDEKAPDADGLLPYEGEYAITPVADADTATDTGFVAAQAFDVACDFTAAIPQDGSAAFAVDLRDGSGVDVRDADGLHAPVSVTDTNGDPPEFYVTLSG